MRPFTGPSASSWRRPDTYFSARATVRSAALSASRAATDEAAGAGGEAVGLLATGAGRALDPFDPFDPFAAVVPGELAQPSATPPIASSAQRWANS